MKPSKISKPPYSRMAAYYDLTYHKLVDYEADCDFLERLFKKHAKSSIRRVLDVGCGTGNHATILARRDYKVIGIDQSKPMLEIARSKVSEGRGNPEFERMDMRRITLERKFDAALVLFGGFGYLLEDRDVESCFKSIRKHLDPKGLLIFEFWQSTGINPASATPNGLRYWDRIEDSTRQVLIRLSTGRYDPQTNRLTIVFDHYVIHPKRRRLVDQFQEIHATRTYNISEIRRLLHATGMKILAFYSKGVESPKPPDISTFRVICVASPAA